MPSHKRDTVRSYLASGSASSMNELYRTPSRHSDLTSYKHRVLFTGDHRRLMSSRIFHRPSIIIPYLVLLILILTVRIPAYAADALSGTAPAVPQQAGGAQGQWQGSDKQAKITLCH